MGLQHLIINDTIPLQYHVKNGILSIQTESISNSATVSHLFKVIQKNL